MQGARRIGRHRHRSLQSLVAKANVKYNNVIRNTPDEFGSGFQLKPHGRKRKQMEEETRRKKKRGNGHNTVSIFSLNDDITIEILSRLPVKSLVRFKCVCKNWSFLIQEDATFIGLHFKYSKARPSLLIISNRIDFSTYNLMISDILFGGSCGAVSAAAFHTIQEIDYTTEHDMILKPINGLIGFFGETRNDYGVCVCNPSTREITPWVESKLLSDLRKKDHEASIINCTLGYDPATKVYKVVGIWESRQPSYTVCEVLNVGDNEWRQIDEVPPYDLEIYGSYVYMNGSIYYNTYSVKVSCANEKNMPKFLVAFDVGSEKFRTIRVPSYVFDRPYYKDTFMFYNVRLLELDDRLGLFIEHGNSGTLKLWLFDDERNKKNSTSSWSEVSIELPYTLDVHRNHVSFNPVPGTSQIILSSYPKTSDGKISDTTYYSYNWKNKSFNEIEISGIPCSVPSITSRSMLAIFSENLLPLRKQTSTKI
ncbi:hypothetical protein MKW98_027937 [Papaver atlanticum]|uniref:F-box domain-containing protein n=1 Tax=Papaver atlanticum TaxID=357466 RepID=A0AAD4S9N2_9MAGN|nr:hypothetical protein MKW98_027937 [Papaver atlanticum]